MVVHLEPVRGRKMKYLAILDFEHADMKALAKKGMEYEELKKKDPDLWPGQFLDVYVMMKGWKAVAVWDATPEQIAHKVAYMYPEVKYTLIPIVHYQEFFKHYMQFNP
jgi:hypothetical protein